MRPIRGLSLLFAVLAALCAYFARIGEARAVPSFARKYQTSCQTCHTIFPVLNPFGEAFRRNGYRFPSQNGSVDSDAVKTSTIALGQEEYVKTFPDTVWPDKIADAVPLSVMVNGGVPVNMPDSDAKAAAGNTFTWGGVVAEVHLYGAGAFNDNVTYMAQVTMESDFGSPPGTFDIETAYLLWNDIVGPRHAVNLWVGRLWAPQLTSFGLHSDYLSDTMMPGISVAGLYNSGPAPIPGQGHADGAELNGIVGHRLAYAVGWIASPTSAGSSPNAEDVYAHVGIKSGGVALDGEGKYGPNVPDPRKPWAEKSITIDAFAYHGLERFDNGTGVTTASPTAVPQDDRYSAIGGSIHGQWDSLLAQVALDYEHHDRPYAGSAAMGGFPGVPVLASANAVVGSAEVNYVVWPWFVPGVRAEYTRADVQDQAGDASLLRIIPGVAMAVRPNIRVIVAGDLENANGAPPNGWGAAGGVIVPAGSGQSKFQAESVSGTFNVAF
jgi:hypothetical protein